MHRSSRREGVRRSSPKEGVCRNSRKEGVRRSSQGEERVLREAARQRAQEQLETKTEIEGAKSPDDVMS